MDEDPKHVFTSVFMGLRAFYFGRPAMTNCSLFTPASLAVAESICSRTKHIEHTMVCLLVIQAFGKHPCWKYNDVHDLFKLWALQIAKKHVCLWYVRALGEATLLKNRRKFHVFFCVLETYVLKTWFFVGCSSFGERPYCKGNNSNWLFKRLGAT